MEEEKDTFVEAIDKDKDRLQEVKETAENKTNEVGNEKYEKLYRAVTIPGVCTTPHHLIRHTILSPRKAGAC